MSSSDLVHLYSRSYDIIMGNVRFIDAGIPPGLPDVNYLDGIFAVGTENESGTLIFFIRTLHT